MYKVKEINVATGEEIVRDFTAEEIAQLEQAQVKAAKLEAKAQAKAEQRAALLERLGLTEEEAKLLLG